MPSPALAIILLLAMLAGNIWPLWRQRTRLAQALAGPASLRRSRAAAHSRDAPHDVAAPDAAANISTRYAGHDPAISPPGTPPRHLARNPARATRPAADRFSAGSALAACH